MAAKIVEEQAFRDRSFVFSDRLQAGELLGEKLREFVGGKSVIILAVPAGGVPVAYAVAKKLTAPMDVLVVRKIQIPWNTEAGFGALTSDGKIVLNEDLVKQLELTEDELNTSILKTKENLQARLQKFRGDKPMPDLADKVVILIDDGLASGFTMLAAVRSVREKNPKKIIVAIPTASLGAIELLMPEIDVIVCLNIRSESSFAVANAYENWYDITDDEVIKILSEKQ
jgi:predicted phosphoribosyltransferase